MALTLTKAERETVIRWDDDDKRIDIYTASPTVARKLTKLGYTTTPQGAGWRVLAPAKSITIRRATRKPRKITHNLPPRPPK